MLNIFPKKKLEMILEEIKVDYKQKIYFEQYQTPVEIVSLILFTATYTFNDIIGKVVCDFGCGCGRFALGSKILGAKRVIGIDIDPDAIRCSLNYAKKLKLKNIDWILGDLSYLNIKCNTVIQNPPFGTKKRHSDIIFLRKAFGCANVVYSIHKYTEEIRRYIEKVARKEKFIISKIIPLKLEIPFTYEFHIKPKYYVDAAVFRFERVTM